MYIDSSTTKRDGKSYTRHLLRESYRENGKVKHRTIANLSDCSPEEIGAMRLALRHKKDLIGLLDAAPKVSVPMLRQVGTKQGLSFGAVWLVYDMARQLGIADALGSAREGKLALWQVIARVVDQGSRLSAVRLAGYHAACDVIGLERFDEDDLYQNLAWLSGNQATIEDRLFKKRKDKPGLFLYDVTSSYLEGEKNELSAFGYNRDGKNGKRQIVIGLLCDESGRPLSIEVFAGNTQDPKTVASQIKKVAERFGGNDVTLVGDRGMIKNGQIGELGEHGFHYITAITKPQIEKLLKEDVIQMGLFESNVAEVKSMEGVRYILRRNPVRASEMRKTRDGKLASLRNEVEKLNQYLKEHPRSRVEVSVKKLNERCRRLKLSGWASISVSDRELTLTVDKELLSEDAKLDGCYVLKTDLTEAAAAKETVHDRYKDLTLVESAFRTSKTVELELRPIHVRLETSTRGHAFVVMMAYMIVKELAKRWNKLETTVEEGIKELSTLCAIEVMSKDKVLFNQIPTPRESVKRLLESAKVRLPETLPCKGVKVTTKKKLVSRRKSP